MTIFNLDFPALHLYFIDVFYKSSKKYTMQILNFMFLRNKLNEKTSLRTGLDKNCSDSDNEMIDRIWAYPLISFHYGSVTGEFV